MTRSSVSGVMSGHSGSPQTRPALLCTMSTPPCSASAAANIASSERGSVTSVRVNDAVPPTSCTSPTVSSPPTSSTSATTTRCPRFANASAVARPMPDPAPVTTATLPRSSKCLVAFAPASRPSGHASAAPLVWPLPLWASHSRTGREHVPVPVTDRPLAPPGAGPRIGDRGRGGPPSSGTPRCGSPTGSATSSWKRPNDAAGHLGVCATRCDPDPQRLVRDARPDVRRRGARARPTRNARSAASGTRSRHGRRGRGSCRAPGRTVRSVRDRAPARVAGDVEPVLAHHFDRRRCWRVRPTASCPPSGHARRRRAARGARAAAPRPSASGRCCLCTRPGAR